MRALSQDATTSLLRAIVNFVNFDVCFEEIRSRSWASVTFTGARHELALRLNGDGAEEAADRLCGGLDTAELDLRGHILADIALVSRDTPDQAGVRIRLEALTVEDA
jgi:hypothetical protein